MPYAEWRRYPPALGEVKRALSFSRRALAPELCQPRHVKREDREVVRKPKGWDPGFSKAYVVSAISIPTTIKNRKQDADKRWSYPPHRRVRRRPAGRLVCRRPTTALTKETRHP